jgi:hypothetical protein
MFAAPAMLIYLRAPSNPPVAMSSTRLAIDAALAARARLQIERPDGEGRDFSLS